MKKRFWKNLRSSLQYIFYLTFIILLILYKTKKLPRKLEQDDLTLDVRNLAESLQLASNQNNDLFDTKFNKDCDNYWNKEIQKKVFLETIPNRNFVFHNKLPKSGSSTMNNILKILSKKLMYEFLKVEAGDVGTFETDKLIHYINQVKNDRFLLLKHHEYFDFTKFNSEQPTYINVMRDPIEWFTSRYYFSRYGWSRKLGCREDCGMSEDEKNMTIDECVHRKHIQCTQPWIYISFFCDIDNPKCFNLITHEQKKEAVEIAKYNILHNYYVVGILEQFEDTLNMFDRLLPTFYKDAANAWKSQFVQEKQELTKTVNKKEMSEESKQYFRDGPLHYELELYNFAKKVFNERMKRLNIEPVILQN